MDTATSDKSAIFARLDDLNFGTASSISETATTELPAFSNEQGRQAKAISSTVSDKAYRKLTASDNATSNSLLDLLHSCPRKYELDKLAASAQPISFSDEDINLHFAFGHAVGAGIQTYAATRNLTAALLATWLSWRAPWEAESTKKIYGKEVKTGKSLTWACYAVEKFTYFWEKNFQDWEVATLPNGKPAVEVAFAIDTQNGYYHFGHIDVILYNRVAKKLAVWEGKTVVGNVDEAMFANSNQALGYSVVTDAIAKQLGIDGSDYEVFYIVYSAGDREFQVLPFGKSRSQRAEWLQDLLLDHSTLDTYKKLNFYPKRGAACYNFYRRCQWFGQCTMKNSSLFPGITAKQINNIDEIEALDFKFTLAELIEAQRG